MCDVAILGGGPAGVAAAIQLRRYGITPTLFEADEIGGLLRNANLVENYPGFPAGIDGNILIGLLKQHLEQVGIEVRNERVMLLDYADNSFRMETVNSTIRCRVVLVASGTRPVKLLLHGLSDAEGSRVFYEVRHIAGVQGKHIAIIGAGDAAFDYALNLARQNRVTISNRGTRVSCLPLLWTRAVEAANIVYRENIALSTFLTTDSGIDLELLQNGQTISESADYLLIAIGRVPTLDFMSDTLNARRKELETAGKLYFMGDVKNGLYRQASISIGDGVKAAMMAARTLSESER